MLAQDHMFSHHGVNITPPFLQCIIYNRSENVQFLMGYAGDPSCVHYKSRFIISRGQNNESLLYTI